jgi:hypothetical protein
MPSVYWVRVAGDGLSPATAFRPSIGPGISYAPLMISETLGRALIVSPDDAIAAPNVTRLLTAASWQALRDLARTSSPTGAQRNAVNTQLSAVGMLTVTAAMTWAQAIGHIARQVNPAADLESIRINT